MTFRVEYAEKSLSRLSEHMKNQLRNEESYRQTKELTLNWETNIHVSGFWHFHIQFQIKDNHETIIVRHQNRNGHVIYYENGRIIHQTGIRRFDMLFAALNDDVFVYLNNNKTFKITRKKLNERYLTKTPYFWEKIEYYLFKKEIQLKMFELFGDRKYKTRAVRIEKAIKRYSDNIRNFIEDTKTLSQQT